jgi:hypothetical protein
MSGYSCFSYEQIKYCSLACAYLQRRFFVDVVQNHAIELKRRLLSIKISTCIYVSIIFILHLPENKENEMSKQWTFYWHVEVYMLNTCLWIFTLTMTIKECLLTYSTSLNKRMHKKKRLLCLNHSKPNCCLRLTQYTWKSGRRINMHAYNIIITSKASQI